MKKKVSPKVVATVVGAFVIVGVLALLAYANLSGGRADSELIVESDFLYENQPSLGDPDAPVKIVEFGDFKCPYCKSWTENVFPKLQEKYIDTGMAEFFFVNLAFVGPDSPVAAEVGEAIFAQGDDLFFKYYDLVHKFQGPKDEVWATEDFLLGLVEEHIPEVDMERLRADLTSGIYAKKVTDDTNFASDIGVDTVPTVFVNGKKVDDPLDVKNIERLIEDALQSVKK